MTALNESFPATSVRDPQDEQAIVKIVQFLETRIRSGDLLREDLREKQNHFRNILVEVERENTSLRYDNNEQKKLISVLEGRVCKLQNNIDGLLCKLNNACDAIRSIQQELRNKDKQLKLQTLEKQKIIQKYDVKIQKEVNRVTQDMERKLQEQRQRLMSFIKKKDDRMKLVRQILTSAQEGMSDNVISAPPIASSSRLESTENEDLTLYEKNSSGDYMKSSRRRSHWKSVDVGIGLDDAREKDAEESNWSLSREKPTVTFADSQTSAPYDQIEETSLHDNFDNVQSNIAVIPESKTEIPKEVNNNIPVSFSSSSATASIDTVVAKSKIPVVNLRYCRVQNVDRWIDHRPARTVPTGTILQPRMQLHRRTICKLTNPKDFASRTSRYCLLSQEQDTDGELETKLYKADVLPTCGGGAQIIFNDIECLKQVSPT